MGAAVSLEPEEESMDALREKAEATWEADLAFAWRQGFVEGFAKGFVEGFAETAGKGRLEVVRRVVRNGFAMGVPEADIAAILDMSVEGVIAFATHTP
jgi:hypothetical protein